MINATAAAIASKEQLDSMNAELASKLESTIKSAIQQGSCKATFYPRNQFENKNACEMLIEHGYKAVCVPSKDQRDNDRIEIAWG